MEDEDGYLREVFELFDTANRGFIDANELQFAISALGCYPKKEQIKELLEYVNVEKDGSVTFEEFVDIVEQQLQHRASAAKELRKAFRWLDGEEKNFVTAEDLCQVAQEVGDDISWEEAEAMVAVADSTGTGRVRFSDFRDLMTRDLSFGP